MGAPFLFKARDRVVEEIHFTGPLLFDNSISIRNILHLELEVGFLCIEASQGDIIIFN